MYVVTGFITSWFNTPRACKWSQVPQIYAVAAARYTPIYAGNIVDLSFTRVALSFAAHPQGGAPTGLSKTPHAVCQRDFF